MTRELNANFRFGSSRFDLVQKVRKGRTKSKILVFLIFNDSVRPNRTSYLHE